MSNTLTKPATVYLVRKTFKHDVLARYTFESWDEAMRIIYFPTHPQHEEIMECRRRHGGERFVAVAINDGSAERWWVDGYEHQYDGIEPIILAVEVTTPLADDQVSLVERAMLIGEAQR